MASLVPVQIISYYQSNYKKIHADKVQGGAELTDTFQI